MIEGSVRVFDPDVVRKLLKSNCSHGKQLIEITTEVGALIIPIKQYIVLGGKVEYLKPE